MSQKVFMQIQYWLISILSVSLKTKDKNNSLSYLTILRIDKLTQEGKETGKKTQPRNVGILCQYKLLLFLLSYNFCTKDCMYVRH